MKAYLLRKTGKPTILKMEDVPEPTPGAGEVKVKVETIGINYAETLSRRGQYSWAPKKPYILGMECYGEVAEIGEGVERHKVGDKVIVGQQYGNYAEYTCAKDHLCFPAVPEFTPEEQAAYLVNFMTAWVALTKLCRLSKGERVLIQAAAGGVGTAAVQIAYKMGCRVYGTASKPEKLELIKKLGADVATNYATQDFFEEIMKDGGGVDGVLEVVGGEVFKKSIELLKPFGRIAVVGFASINLKWWNPLSVWKTYKDAPKVQLMKMAQHSLSIGASHIGYLTDKEQYTAAIWEELKSFVLAHKLRPVVGKVFSFEELPQAHAYMESRASTGKIVVTI